MAGGTGLTGSSDINWAWVFTNETTGISTFTGPRSSEKLTHPISWTRSGGTNNADQLWFDVRTVTSVTATDDLDLAGVLTNIFGETVTFATIREIVILNTSTTAGDDLLVGGAPAAPLANLFNASGPSMITIRAGGYAARGAPLDGYTVTAGTGDTLRIAYSGSSGAITYRIMIRGTE